MSKEFKPTHVLHYSSETSLKEMFPEGVPVVQGSVDEDGLIEWLVDSEGNSGGYTLPLYVGDINRGLFNSVVPIKD